MTQQGTAERLLLTARHAMEPKRRDAKCVVPLGARALRTRASLLRAAWEVFSEKGYRATRPADIAARAGTSVGSFYQYFSSRSEVMAALLATIVESKLTDGTGTVVRASGPEDVHHLIDAFLRSYQATAAFQAAWEEAMPADDDLAEVRRALSSWFIDGLADELRHGQEEGLVRAELDPAVAACALCSMLDRYCYMTFVFDPPDPPTPIERSVQALTDIWSAAIWVTPAKDVASSSSP